MARTPTEIELRTAAVQMGIIPDATHAIPGEKRKLVAVALVKAVKDEEKAAESSGHIGEFADQIETLTERLSSTLSDQQIAAVLRAVAPLIWRTTHE